MREQFETYVQTYQQDIYEIDLKYHHSYRVMDRMEWLGKKIQLSKEDIALAKFIGLYHDIARFEQWKQYQTFSDRKSFDHGNYGVKIMEETFPQFLEQNRSIILDAIYYHNKIEIPDTLPPKNLLFARMIQDADKLDILYECAQRIIKLEVSNDEIRQEAKEAFFNHELVNKKYVQGKTGHILVILAFVFNFYFKASYEYIEQENLIDQIYQTLNQKELLSDYFEEARQFIRKKEYNVGEKI